MKKFRMIGFASCFVAVAACGNSEEVREEEEEVTEEEEQETVEEVEDEEEPVEEEEDGEDDDSATEPTAVSPTDHDDTIEFQHVNWILGSPDYYAEPGVWLYTEEDYPDDYENTFDFGEEDVLVYQIGDEEYLGHSFRAQHIIIEDEDTVRIEVEHNDEPDEDADESDLNMPRQFLRVDQEVLRDKGFIIETTDGEVLSLE
ncbi:hypothetical protein JCM19037_3480 [Geomicrobium sp. JCM 19037]|uniref:hypothetical protein n=1 Tax=Geomicrobium sp. JCM 19037 TaxID=1460634 RepID=UPI00045F1801|nr:hypothetical protein [Geomicrobium sp. JCM 19037]GAK05018.1 hypothetical protein JCM19037_3480 [Geomicrobium sp. JCM 19037]